MRYVGGKHHGTVHVDGVELADVVECDTELGFAIVCDRDANGDLVLDGENIKQRRVEGVVRFTETPQG